MLSICIPTYNYNVNPLVNELVKQAQDTGEAYELIVVDDCSGNTVLKKENRKLRDLPGVIYLELDKNLGRAAVRNYLAAKASYENLIFLDCDTFPVSKSFISNYLKNINHKIIVGGIAYRDKLEDISFSLRWHYGHKRETRDAKLRSMKPYSSFMTGNFMIKKDILLRIRFDNSLTGYGHEDTLFGIVLKNEQIRIGHIDNPVYHDGLESNNVFMEKTRAGVENLLVIMQKSNIKSELVNEVALAKWFNIIVSLHMLGLIAFLFNTFENILIKQLSKKKPNLKVFDFYKLGYMCKVSLAS